MTDIDSTQPIPPPAAKRGLGAGGFAILGAIVVVVAVIGLALARNQQGQPTSGAAPDFSLETLDGGTFTLSEQRGKVVVINFWASWCAPCHDEAPGLQTLYETYQATHPDRVMFVGVTHADAPDDSRAFVQQYGITFPNLPDTRGVISKNLYRITGVPETFVIGPDGQVAQFYYSAVNPVALANEIDALLEAAT